MRNAVGLLRARSILPAVLGVTDGILTALTLAAGHLTGSDRQMPFGLALRIATGALVSSAFVFYVAHYTQLRGELIHAEKQLNLMSHGRLASTRLGRGARNEALVAALFSSLASFLGALIPLLTGALFPAFRWGPVVMSVIFLGVLGIILARLVHGSYWLWCLGLVWGGLSFSIIGIELHIV